MRVLLSIVVFLILAYGLYLRVSGLERKGLFFYDEAYMALETKYLRDTIALTLDKSPEIKKSLERSSAYQLRYGRPGFNVSSLLASYILGYHDYTNFYLSAFFGALSILLVFIIGYKYYGLIAGIFSAAFLSTSSYHIYYSRSAFSETGGGFFLTFALLLYFLYLRKSAKLYLVLTGLFLGVTYTFGYRYLLFLPIFLFDQFQRKVDFLKRGVILTVCFLAVLVMIELGFRFVQTFYQAYSTAGYFDQLRQRLTAAGYFSFKDWYAYFYYFYKSESMIFFLTLIGSLFFWAYAAMKNVTFAARVVFLTAFTPLLFYTIYSANTGASHGGVFVRYTRSIAVSLPVMALAMGVFMAKLLGSRARTKFILLVVVSLMFLTSWPKNSEVVALRSGYKVASEYLESNEGGTVFSFLNAPVYRFYLGNSVYSPKNLSDLQKLSREKDVRYIAVDASKYYWSEVPSQNYSYANGIIEGKDPEKVFANDYLANALVLGEVFDLGKIRNISDDRTLTQIQLFNVH